MTATNGSPYSRLRGANNEVIGNSEMYSSTGLGIASCKVNGPSAPAIDETREYGE
jgi:uncharacterized protein YegP (UPF0339 family)